MKNKLLIVFTVLITGFLLPSCEEFIESNISSQWVYGTSPSDYSKTDVLTQTFKWKEVKGATSYNLQIFKTTDDTYETVKEFVVDTNVRATQFIYTLKPGYYRWQIYGQNNGSETGLSVFRFQIDSTSDISNQKVVLLTPSNNKISDSLDHEFSWSPLYMAQEYNLQIYTYPYKGGIPLYSVNTKSTSTKHKFTNTGEFAWRVCALNGLLSSPYSEFKLTIDTLLLEVPVVISPKNDTLSITTSPIELRWNTVPKATNYRIQVSEDTTYAPLLMLVNELTNNNNTYSFSKALISTKYYWRVIATKDNKESKPSFWWSFRLN